LPIAREGSSVVEAAAIDPVPAACAVVDMIMSGTPATVAIRIAAAVSVKTSTVPISMIPVVSVRPSMVPIGEAAMVSAIAPMVSTIPIVTPVMITAVSAIKMAMEVVVEVTVKVLVVKVRGRVKERRVAQPKNDDIIAIQREVPP